MDPELRGIIIGLLTLFAWVVVLLIEMAIQRRQRDLELRIEILEDEVAASGRKVDEGR